MMNRLFTALLLVSGLLGVQSCSKTPLPTQSSQSSNAQMSDSQSEHESHSMNHDNHQHETKDSTPATETHATLTLSPKSIQPKQPVSVSIEIQDTSGKAVKNFESFQEKPMHLILVSDDLEFFSHLHPTYQNNGKFVASTSFPKPGNYSFYSDYKPKGEPERVSILKTSVPGSVSATPSIKFDSTKTVENTQVNLKLSQENIKAGEPVTIMFELVDAATKQSATNLEPYLGEMGHLVILKQAKTLSKTDYIHAHALKETPAHQVHFMTQFPEPGNYKMWGQFNRNGKIITADFWVNVK